MPRSNHSSHESPCRRRPLTTTPIEGEDGAGPIVIVGEPVLTTRFNDAVVAQALRSSANLNNYTPEQLENASVWVAFDVDAAGSGLPAANTKEVPGLQAFGDYPGLFLYDAAGQSAADVVGALGAVDSIDYFYPLVPKTPYTTSPDE